MYQSKQYSSDSNFWFIHYVFFPANFLTNQTEHNFVLLISLSKFLSRSLFFVFLIRMGKKKLEESDSDEDDAENERSIVLDNGSDSDSNKETDGSFDSVSGGKLNGDCSGGSCESGSEEEKETFGQVKPEVQEEKVVQATSVSCLDAVGSEAVEPEKGDSDEPKSGNVEVIGLPQSNSGSENGSDIEKVAIDSEDNGVSESKPGVHEEGEESAANTDTSDAGKPLNFDDFSSAAEMEVCLSESIFSST